MSKFKYQIKAKWQSSNFQKLNSPRLEGEGFRKQVDFKSTWLPISSSSSFLRKQESRKQSGKIKPWIPAFAGMTEWWGGSSYLAHVHFVHILPIFASPEGEGFPSSPRGTLNCLIFLEFKLIGHLNFEI
jgi:hypothetical protein